MKLEEMLKKSNLELLSEFKWGSEGEKQFADFIQMIRIQHDNNKHLKSSLDKIFKVTDSFEWHFKNEQTPEGYISKVAREVWINE